MTEIKNSFISITSALYIAFFTAIVHLGTAYFYLDFSWKTFRWGVSLALFLGVFLFSYLLLYVRIEYFIINKVKELYQTFFPAVISSNSLKTDSNIDFLTNKLKQFASDSMLEIEMLKKQENYRKEFIGNLAHELKTPLFTVQGYVLTLLDRGLKDKKIVKKYLKQTAKGVERLEFIIKDLDLITKFESGIETLDYSTFDIRKTLKNVFELLEFQSVKNNISIKMDRNYDYPIWVIADEERIQQVITNLIINSLNYGVYQGATEVSINQPNESKALIRITDNGKGIDKKHLPRLFERFYRVDKTRNRNQGGSGLGLAIVKHIIEAHNEQIFVESKLQVGSEFSFSLSLASKKELLKQL